MGAPSTLQLTDAGSVEVAGRPWLDLGPLPSTTSPALSTAVSLDAVVVGADAAVLSAEGVGLDGLAGVGFADVRVGWSLRPRAADLAALGVRSFGFQYMEFALPSSAGPDGHALAPWPLRPSVAMPIVWGGRDVPALLIGPLDRFHDVAIAVSSDEHPRDDVACGWHGDLDSVDHLRTEFALVAAPTVRAAIARYGELVRARSAVGRRPRAQDAGVRGLSYWTDNGAEYYYRAAAGQTYPETLRDAVEALERDGLPVHAVQLDSWWYPHSTLRELGEGAEIVPPTGAMTWEPRDDALPGGFEAVRDAIGGRPLVLHSRHLDRTSPYFADGGFAPLEGAARDGADSMSGATFVHPADGDLLDAWMEQAASWGACTYEQDWLVEIYLYSAGLRDRPGLADTWLTGMDDAAARRGLTLQLCMATPANLLHAASMTQVSSVRTSMDFRYFADRQSNWGWFLHVNSLARALALPTSKDVFVTTGDDLAVVEAMLAAMSCGPVGLGDPIGATDRDLALRTCREDGVLVQPDAPMAAWSESFFGDPMGTMSPLVGETYSDHPAGRWHYVAAMAADPAARAAVAFGPDHLDSPTADRHVARQDRTGRIVELDAGGSLDLRPGDDALDLWVVAPRLLDGRVALFGDVARFASMGDRRIGRVVERDGALSFLVLGVPGSTVEVVGWSDAAVGVERFLPGGSTPLDVERDDATGAWWAAVGVGPHGWSRATVRMLAG